MLLKKMHACTRMMIQPSLSLTSLNRTVTVAVAKFCLGVVLWSVATTSST